MNRRLIGSLVLGSALWLPSAARATHVLPYEATPNRNWSQDAETIHVTVDAADFEQKTKGAKRLWVVLSSRSQLPEFWNHPANGTPEFTERCVIKKDYDFTWIEANEIPLSSAAAIAKSGQLKVTNAAGAYYVFILVQREGGAFADVKLTKIGDASKNPLKSGAFELKNAQKLTRDWDDDKRHLCGQKGPKPAPPVTYPKGVHPLPFDDLANRNWSTDSDVLYVSVDAADLAKKKQGAKRLWVVLSSRSLMPDFWMHPGNGTPAFTQRCIVKKDYDFGWIEANEVPLANAGPSGFKVTNAKGAYYAFVLVERADGEFEDVKLTKVGDATKNPPQGAPFAVANAQTLNRTWDDDQRWACGQKGAKPPAAVAEEAPMVHPLPFDDLANRNWSTDADVVYLTVDKADLAAKAKDAKRVFVVLSARSLQAGFWKDPTHGIPKLTHTCIANKKYDSKWIEAFEVPVASMKGDQLAISGAKGTYNAFVLVDKGDGRYADVKIAKLGDATKNPPKADALAVKNPQVLTRVWEDDKKPLCK